MVELGLGIPGCYAGKLLLDAGAEVVRVVVGSDREPVPAGPSEEDPAADGDRVLLEHLNRGKGLARLPAPGGGQQFGELLRNVDIVLRSDLGRGVPPPADEVRAANPSAAIVSISWFGAAGPWSGRPANEFTLQASCGSTGGRGPADGPPLAAGGRIGEWAAGAAAAFAALAAWTSRGERAAGGHVAGSIFEAMTVAFNGFHAVAAQLDGQGPEPVRPARSVEVPSIARTSDGWVGVATLRPAHFSAFAEMIGHPEWATDPQLRRSDRRSALASQLLPVIESWTTGHTTAEVVAEAGRRHIPVAPVSDGSTVTSVDYFVERGVFRGTEDGRLVPRPPYQTAPPPLLPPSPLARPTTPPERPATTPEPVAVGGKRPGPAAAGRPADPDLPLTGLRVFDLTSTWAGPYAGQLLGFLGADVVKVESIQRPDGTRLSTAFATVGDRPWEYSPMFQAVNTGKRGVTLDLGSDAGRRLGRELLLGCDVLVENFTPKVLERFGLLDEKLWQANPGLIVLRMPAWGLSGTWRDRPGFAQTMEQVTGLAAATGFADGPPVVPRGPCDPIGAWHGAFAVLAALEHRRRTGEGAVIEAPLVESALNIAVEGVLRYAEVGQPSARLGNRSATAAPQNLYRARGEDAWIALSVETDAQWAALLSVLGGPPWAAESRWSSAAGRRDGQEELDGHLDAALSETEADDVVERLCAAGVPAAVVVGPRLVTDNPQHRARRFYETVEHPLIGTLGLPRFPGTWEGRHTWHSSPAPTLGQHNHEILAGDLGVGADELARLAEDRVIGDRPVL